MELDRPWFGPFRDVEHLQVLPQSRGIASLALVPLRRGEHLDGVLVFGSRDPRRFTPDLASDYMAHLGVIAAICLENAVNRARLVRSGLTDFLTGFHNRRYMNARLREELARAHRDQRTVACLMIDVDHFKRINDAYGHLAGDAVLREVARRIDGEIRTSDTGARFGGDEFAIVLPGGNVREAEALANRVLSTRQQNAGAGETGRPRPPSRCRSVSRWPARRREARSTCRQLVGAADEPRPMRRSTAPRRRAATA